MSEETPIPLVWTCAADRMLRRLPPSAEVRSCWNGQLRSHTSAAAMRNAGSARAVAFGLLALTALATAASSSCVKSAASAGAAKVAVSEEADAPSGSGMYLVPRLGKNPVLGPVTGAPPGKLAHVPLSAPSVSVRRKDEPVTQPRLPEKRSVAEAPPEEDREAYYRALVDAAQRHPRRRHPRLGSLSLMQASVR
ncbi:uncharacterized protein LOC126418743 isoform X2 [Schistocerca serialis cubense]|uniref:uncharacterized protein LOC126418743 isoform X2 n=1 Tax=Schistocerca serialis cubense TaxID=2023355 RepID=UPI00214EF4DA|nr:uncharacterized protein LOC126418743 isoform X2 [Schistocerca serialis cubense]